MSTELTLLARWGFAQLTRNKKKNLHAFAMLVGPQVGGDTTREGCQLVVLPSVAP